MKDVKNRGTNDKDRVPANNLGHSLFARVLEIFPEVALDRTLRTSTFRPTMQLLGTTRVKAKAWPGLCLVAVGLAFLPGPRLAAAPLCPVHEVGQLVPGKNNRLLLPASILGEKFFFLVDSGAYVSAIDEGMAKRLALAAPPRETGIPGRVSMNGKNFKVGWLPDFQVGKVNLGPGPMAIVPADSFSQISYQGQTGRVHGLFGVDLLRLHRAVIDCRSRGLFFKSDLPDSEKLSSSLLEAGYRTVPLVEQRGHILVPVRLRAQEYLMTVDTGSPVTLIQEKKMLEIGIHAESTQFKVGGINVPHSKVGVLTSEVHRLRIADLPIGESIGVTPSKLIGGRDRTLSLGLLGLDILGLHGAVIDFDTMTLYLLPGRATPAAKK